MIDKEKVLMGLECCSMNGNGCRQCPYNKECDEMPDFGNAQLCSDALELLKSQPEQEHGHWKGFTQSRYFGKDDYGEPICEKALSNIRTALGAEPRWMER